MTRNVKIPVYLLEKIVWLLDDMGVYRCGRDCEHAFSDMFSEMKMNAKKIELRNLCWQIIYEDYVKYERKKALRKELREYIPAFSDMTYEERKELNDWVADGNSPYENPYSICDDSGRPMDFVNGLRFASDMAEMPFQSIDSDFDDIEVGEVPF